jgi:hypothetical protein
VTWFERDTTTDDREVALIRAMLESLKGFDVTALIGADALMQLMDARDLTFARDALKVWIAQRERW